MKYVSAMLGLLLVGVCSAAGTPLLPARVGDAVNQRIAAGEYPAMVIAVVDGDRSAVYGFGKLDDGKQPDASTVFEIGSVTKTFTALLLAQEVSAGKLSLDQPVASLLPGFSIPSRDSKLITLGNLAMQHSGLPRMPTNFVPANPDDPYVDYGVDKLKVFLAGYTLPRDPGASYEYSNLGVGLLGYALGQQAGTGYEKLLQRQILNPLGMHSSGITLSDAGRAQMAVGHDAAGKAMSNWHLNALAAAGGILSAGTDMLGYLKANMGLSSSLLYPGMQFAQAPRADGQAADERIGLVWMTQHRAEGDVIWHNGMTGGYASFIGFTADRRHGVVILTNTAQSVDDLGFATLRVDAPLEPAHKRISLSPQALDAYVGSYQLAPQFIVKVFRVDGQLMTQATGQGAFPIFASAVDEFFATVSDISISFKRDGGGKVGSLVLHQHGDHAAPRLNDADADARHGNKVVVLDPATLGGYVGEYQLTPNAMFKVTLKDGQLLVKLANQPALPVYANARDKFFCRVVDAKIDFERDAGGKVVVLVLHQNGADMRAARVSH